MNELLSKLSNKQNLFFLHSFNLIYSEIWTKPRSNQQVRPETISISNRVDRIYFPASEMLSEEIRLYKGLWRINFN